MLFQHQVYRYGNPSHPSTLRQIGFRSAKEPLLYDLEKRKKGSQKPNNKAQYYYFTYLFSLSFSPTYSFLLTLSKSHKNPTTVPKFRDKSRKRSCLSGGMICLEFVLAICQIDNSKAREVCSQGKQREKEEVRGHSTLKPT